MLDFAPAPSCGRCQSHARRNTVNLCPPSSLSIDLRDHLFAKSPYLIGGRMTMPEGARRWHRVTASNGHGVPESGFGGSPVPGETKRPPAGALSSRRVIDPYVLWRAPRA